jgi:hypothetical protein
VEAGPPKQENLDTFPFRGLPLRGGAAGRKRIGLTGWNANGSRNPRFFMQFWFVFFPQRE